MLAEYPLLPASRDAHEIYCDAIPPIGCALAALTASLRKGDQDLIARDVPVTASNPFK